MFFAGVMHSESDSSLVRPQVELRLAHRVKTAHLGAPAVWSFDRWPVYRDEGFSHAVLYEKDATGSLLFWRGYLAGLDRAPGTLDEAAPRA